MKMNFWEKRKNLKKHREELQKKEAEIKEQWENKWKNQPEVTVNSRDVYFLGWLLENLIFLESGIAWNKKKNFFMKGIVLAVFAAAYVAMFCLEYMVKSLALVNLIVLFIPPYIIHKWIGVKKYQETWSRYTGYRSRIIQEMTKYLYDIAPYNQRDTKMVFIANILKTTRANTQKFQENMTEKEEKIFSGSLKGMKEEG